MTNRFYEHKTTRCYLLRAIALASLVIAPTTASAAANFPTDFNLGNGDGLVALYDYDDFVSHRDPQASIGPDGGRSYQSLKYVHLLPDALDPGVNSLTSEYDFAFLPVLNNGGGIEELIIDFSLVTHLSAEAQTTAKGLFPAATLFYPTATSSAFRQLAGVSGVAVEGAFAGQSVLLTPGSPESVRLHLSKVALRNYAYAIEGLARVAASEAKLGRAAPLNEDNLSILLGSLQQTYQSIHNDPISGVPSYVALAHTLALRLNSKQQRGHSLSALIAATIKTYAPRCGLDPSRDIRSQVNLPSWNAIVDHAQSSSVNLFDLDSGCSPKDSPAALIPEESYMLKSAYTGKCINLEAKNLLSDGFSEGGRIQQWDCPVQDGEWVNNFWKLIKSADGSYQLASEHSGLCVGTWPSASSVGQSTAQFRCDSTSALHFEFEPIGSQGYHLKTTSEGVCLTFDTVQNANDNGKTLYLDHCAPTATSSDGQVFQLDKAHGVNQSSVSPTHAGDKAQRRPSHDSAAQNSQGR